MSMTHSKPIVEKTPEITAEGYDESAFAENYWLVPDANGCRRIDRSADALIRYADKLVNLQALPPSPRVLDISSGPGMVVHQFRKAGYICDGCEFSSSGRRIAKAEFNIELLHGDLRERLPYEDGSYDFAMCVGVLTMIPEMHIRNALSEIRRVIAKGGIAHLHLINPDLVEGEPHITNLPLVNWWRLTKEAGFTDVTSIWPPQREGIGMHNEFSGIFQA